MLGEFLAFRIDIVPSSCEVNVVVAGDIDVATAHDLEEHLQAVERSSRDVVIDRRAPPRRWQAVGGARPVGRRRR